MIKIDNFQVDRDQLADYYAKNILSPAIQHWDDPWNKHPAYHPRPKLTESQVDDAVKHALSNASYEEQWINPSEIKTINVRKMVDGQKFLEIVMKDDQSFNVKGESVQEFFMRNVIFGEDIG